MIPPAKALNLSLTAWSPLATRLSAWTCTARSMSSTALADEEVAAVCHLEWVRVEALEYHRGQRL